jgi:hypothetical protein
MTFGLKTINDAGTVQFDDTYASLSFISKGTITQASTQNGTGGSGAYTISFSASSKALVAFTISTGYVTNYKISFSSGTWEYRFKVAAADQGRTPPTTFTLTYYIFDVPPATTPTGFGLWVADGSGNKTFRNDYKPLKVAGYAARTSGSSGSITLTGGPQYAVIQSGIRIFSAGFNISGFTSASAFGVAFKIASNVITSGSIFFDGGAPDQLTTPQASGVLSVDVSGY